MAKSPFTPNRSTKIHVPKPRKPKKPHVPKVRAPRVHMPKAPHPKISKAGTVKWLAGQKAAGISPKKPRKGVAHVRAHVSVGHGKVRAVRGFTQRRSPRRRRRL